MPAPYSFGNEATQGELLMTKINLIALALISLALSACGKSAAQEAIEGIRLVPQQPIVEPVTPKGAGKINGKEFVVRGAGISKDPYIMGMYQLLIYNEKHSSACYGLGDTFIKIPVSQTNTVGRHDLQNNRVWSALFYDVGREYREASGYSVINTLDASGGSATLVIGTEGSNNFLRGDVAFENCIKD
jgi:hypothetical protein